MKCRVSNSLVNLKYSGKNKSLVWLYSLPIFSDTCWPLTLLWALLIKDKSEPEIYGLI